MFQHRYYVVCLLCFAAAALSAVELEDEINREIDSLNSELQSTRQEALNKEMKAQPLMLDNWKEYSENIQSEENTEKHILELKKKIEALEQKKQGLKKS